MLLTFSDYLKNNKTTVILAFVLIAVALLVALFIVNYFMKKKTKGNRGEVIRRMVTIAIFSSLSILFYLTLKFPLPFAPSFLKFNFSNLPIIIGSFMMGPVEGVIIVLIRTIVVVPQTGTFCVGELADLILSTCIALVSGIIYNKLKSKKGAYIALGSTVVVWIAVSMLANYLILAPAYITLFFGGNVAPFIGMLSVIPNVNEANYMAKYIFAGVLPFNACISVATVLITFIVYKRISFLFHYFDKKIAGEEAEEVTETQE